MKKLDRLTKMKIKELNQVKEFVYKRKRPIFDSYFSGKHYNYMTSVDHMDLLKDLSIPNEKYGYGNGNRVKTEDIKESNFNGEIYHCNYIQYLNTAYKNDFGIEIKPDHVWFTIMAEFSRMIKGDDERFRKYFTKEKEGKIEIKVGKNPTGWMLPVDVVSDILINSCIPTNLVEEDILPEFSTTTPESTFAFQCVFLDAMSPYYTYSMYGCGYKKIKIYGEIADYEKMIKNLNKISGLIPEFKEYSDRCIATIIDMIANWDNKEFWKNILMSKAAYLADIYDGWFTNFYVMSRPRELPQDDYARQTYGITSGWYDSEFPSHIARVDYDILNPFDDSVMAEMSIFCGIMNSKIEDDCFVPQFNYFRIEKVLDEAFYKYPIV